MIESALEIINQAASNSLFMFCFCNLIIFFILIGSPKSGPEPDPKPGFQTGRISGSTLSSRPNFHHGRLEPAIRRSSCDPKPGPYTTTLNVDVEVERRKPLSNGIEMREFNNVTAEDGSRKGEEENEVDAALRKRVEDFIHKVNSQWKSENIKFYRF